MSRRYAIALVVLLLAGTAGCAQGQEYAVPRDVCGVEVQSALLKPLLPPGDSFKQRKTQEGVKTSPAARWTSTIDAN